MAGKISAIAWSVSNSSSVHLLSHCSAWTGQLLDTLRLKAQAISDGSNFNDDPHKLQVTP